ncbi:MAG: hypothetical protein AABX29_01910, partial [Nanoarchaeota archaeon]
MVKDSEEIKDQYEIKYGMRYPDRYIGLIIYCTFKIDPEDKEKIFETSIIPAMKALLSYLEEEFSGVDKFRLIFTQGGNKPRYEINGNDVYVNYDKWIDFFKKIKKYTDEFRITR